MMNYYICKIFHPTTSLYFGSLCNFGPLQLLWRDGILTTFASILPQNQEISTNKTITDSIRDILNSLFLYLKMLVTQIFDSLLSSTAIWFFLCIQEFEKTLLKCGGMEIFYYFYFLNSRNIHHFCINRSLAGWAHSQRRVGVNITIPLH